MLANKLKIYKERPDNLCKKYKIKYLQNNKQN